MEKLPENKPLLRTAAMRAASAMSFPDSKGLYDGGLNPANHEPGVEDEGLFICMDCGIDTYKIREYFMVEDHIWEEHVPEYHGILCVGCLEARMGRKLDSKDFPPRLLVNTPDGFFFPHSERLKTRLTTD